MYNNKTYFNKKNLTRLGIGITVAFVAATVFADDANAGTKMMKGITKELVDFIKGDGRLMINTGLAASGGIASLMSRNWVPAVTAGGAMAVYNIIANSVVV